MNAASIVIYQNTEPQVKSPPKYAVEQGILFIFSFRSIIMKHQRKCIFS